jgi:predicted esterase YcpF (UPF0227 family)
MNVISIKYRNCKPENLEISNCLKIIYDKIKNDDEVILIGSSFGGYLALRILLLSKNISKIILLNPSIMPPTTDINKIKSMPKKILEEMKDNNFFKYKFQSKIYIILGSNDKIVPNSWSINFAKFQEASILFLNDDHCFSKNIEKIPNIIFNIINQNN